MDEQAVVEPGLCEVLAVPVGKVLWTMICDVLTLLGEDGVETCEGENFGGARPPAREQRAARKCAREQQMRHAPSRRGWGPK